MEREVLIAPEGMVYQNGGKRIYLAVGETADKYHLISEEEYETAMQAGVVPGEISDSEALAILTGGTHDTK